jgi:hypothetical protein
VTEEGDLWRHALPALARETRADVIAVARSRYLSSTVGLVLIDVVDVSRHEIAQTLAGIQPGRAAVRADDWLRARPTATMLRGTDINLRALRRGLVASAPSR